MKILVMLPPGHMRDTFAPDPVPRELEQLGEVIWNNDPEISPEAFRALLPGVEVLISDWGTPKLTEEVLSAADALKIVAHTGGTVADLVTDAVYDRGITVLSGNEVYAESVAESVIAYALTALRQIPRYQQALRRDGWRGPAIPYHEGLLDKTVGLVGYGAVVRHLIPMLRVFRTPIRIWADYLTVEDEQRLGVRKASPEEIFSTCQIVSVHKAMTEKNYHCVDRRLLSMLPRGALFINTARGGVVDEAALAEELKKQRFQAVLDVFEQEPLPMESPLRQLPNVTLIPHMAGPTLDRRKFVTLGLIREIRRMQQGLKPADLEVTRQMASRMTRSL